MATPALIKSFSRNPALRAIVCWCVAQMIRLVHLTGRWRTVRAEIPAEFWDKDQPVIACFWHGRLLMMGYNWDRRRDIHLLISSHADGQLVAGMVRHFGFNSVAGSTRRGGSEALRGMLRIIKSGGSICITPDGPRGPRMRAGMGPVALAKLTGVPILPSAYAVSRRRLVNSWDRFLLPGLFARGVYVWGTPINVPKDADDDHMEELRRQLETELNRITDEADDLCGAEKVEPAAEAAMNPEGASL
jgi:lysophospholipid acyltransferase (LPLAT)-like uncharacterized protein